MTLEVVLRGAQHADAEKFAEADLALFGSQAWSVPMYLEEIDGPGRSYLVAEVADQFVGYAGIWFNGDDAQLMTIGVLHQWQGQGIARALLAELIEQARHLGADRMLLEVAVDNARAIRLYEAAGFTVFGRRRRYYQPEGTDAWTMAKQLGTAERGPDGS